MNIRCKRYECLRCISYKYLSCKNYKHSLGTTSSAVNYYHIGFYQFEMPLEYDISDFLIFCSCYEGKSGERKKINFPRWPSDLPAN